MLAFRVWDRMSENNKYQIPSTAHWEIPGDVPGRSRLYSGDAKEDEYQDHYEADTAEQHTVANDFYKNQLVRSLSKKTQTISQVGKEVSENKKRLFVQPAVILLLIMLGMLLGLTKFDVQISLKGNDSFAANTVKTVSHDKEIISDLGNVTEKNETIVLKEIADTKAAENQPVLLLKLTDKPVSESKIIIHTVVKGDTLWDIAEYYVKDPFRYPELAKLSSIVIPDLIYPGNIVRIQI